MDKTDYSFIKCATDDVIIILKADPAKPDALYSRIRGLDKKLDMEAAKVGLSFQTTRVRCSYPLDGSLQPISPCYPHLISDQT